MTSRPKNSKTVKALAISSAVPQSRDAAAQAILDIGTAQRERICIQAAMNDEIAAVKARYEAQAAPWNERIQALRDGVQIYCEAHRDELTQGGKVKFGTFTTGEVKWRLTPPAVSVRNVAATIQLLLAKGFGRFVRVKEELNKEAILAEAGAADELARAGVAGISISQREEFVIEPFETKLEEVL